MFGKLKPEIRETWKAILKTSKFWGCWPILKKSVFQKVAKKLKKTWDPICFFSTLYLTHRAGSKGQFKSIDWLKMRPPTFLCNPQNDQLGKGMGRLWEGIVR